MHQNTLVSRDDTVSSDPVFSGEKDNHGDDTNEDDTRSISSDPIFSGDENDEDDNHEEDNHQDATNGDDTDEDDTRSISSDPVFSGDENDDTKIEILHTDEMNEYKAPVIIKFPGLVGCLALIHLGEEDDCVLGHHVSGLHLSCLLNKKHRMMFMMMGQAGVIEINAAESYKKVSEEFRRDHPGETYMCGPNMDSVAQAAYNIPEANMVKTEEGPVTATFNTVTKSWTWEKD